MSSRTMTILKVAYTATNLSKCKYTCSLSSYLVFTQVLVAVAELQDFNLRTSSETENRRVGAASATTSCSDSPPHILIVGAGPVGSLTASLLAKVGYKV